MKLRSGLRVTLPPELLRMIFIAYADPPFEKYGPFYWYQSRSMRWIAITHVCRYWRSVALGYSDLWKRLHFFNPDATKEMIRRSKGANLEVIIDTRHQQIERSTVIPVVLPELHRVSVLHLVCSDELQSLVNSLVSAVPKLEYLFLGTLYGSALQIPDTVFSPALRSLELHVCTFTSPSPSSGTVSSPYSRIGPIPSTISQIVSSLRGTPMLHTLIFDEVLPLVDTDDTCPNLVLPKLSRLELTSSVASCTNFLEHIIFPVTTDTTVTCLNPSQGDDYGRLFHTFLSVMGNRKANSVISAITFWVSSDHRSNTASILCTIIHSHQTAPTKVTFKFSMDVYDDELFRDIFDAASVTLPLTNVDELDIVGFGPGLVISFDSLSDIHTIRFKECIPALEVVHGVLADNKLQLRSLCSLQFYDVEFLDEAIPILMDGLERRLFSGFPIEYIRLDKCFNLKQADVIFMQELVQDVEWDGKGY
jgi:F-box-like